MKGYNPTLVDEPELIDAADDISIDRWQEYGHDRLYINGARVEPYIDLETGELGDTGRVRVNVGYDGDTATIEIGNEDSHSRHDVIVISLSGDNQMDDEDEDDDTPGSDTDNDDRTQPLTEARFDELERGDLVQRVDEPEPREVIRVPEPNPLAGHVTSIEVQQATIPRDAIDNWEVVEQ